MLKICEECGNEYKTYKVRSKFCSMECRAKNSRLKDIPCEVCGVMFHPSKSTVKTCSKECGYKRLSLGVRKCLYCGEEFRPEHSTNIYCSRECSSKAHIKYPEQECIICGEIFKPHTENHLCCSISCGQIYNRNRKTQEEKEATIKSMIGGIKETSKINSDFCKLLEDEGYSVDTEHWVEMYRYDIKIGNILIEINPFVFHNSTRCPKIDGAEKKEKYYHYNKAKCAIDNGYNIIMVWDWISFNELIYIIHNIEHTTQRTEPTLHRYNKKTKEHIIDDDFNKEEMINRGFVEIYDAGEQYIFNSTDIS